jgi:hypothetical protein
MQCPKCGRINSATSPYCTKCGYSFFSADLDLEPPEPLKNPPRRKVDAGRVLMTILTILLMGVGIGLIGGVIGFLRNKKDRLVGAMIGSIASAILVPALIIIGIQLKPAITKMDLPELIPGIIPNPLTLHSTPTVEIPSPTPTLALTAPPSCSTWDQVTVDMEGTILCVYGTVVSVYPITGNKGNTITRINFSTQKNTFFILSNASIFSLAAGGTQQEIKRGDCVRFVDTVRILNTGTQQIPFMQVKQILTCSN